MPTERQARPCDQVTLRPAVSLRFDRSQLVRLFGYFRLVRVPEAGINFTRACTQPLGTSPTCLEGDEPFKFGTLVFFNSLGHVGIVADENGFYQASSSKGITYSPFEGYWQSRIVGFRRLKPESLTEPTAATK